MQRQFFTHGSVNFFAFSERSQAMRSVSRRTFLKATGGLAASSSAFLSACAGSPSTGAKKILNFWAFSDTRTAWQKKAWELYKQQKQPDFEINWLIFPYQQMRSEE